jgi:hypothetical protein
MSSLSGKKPLSSKAKTTSAMNEPDFFLNPLAVAKDVKAELDKKGLDYRWISYTKYVASGGQHERGWTVYKRDKKAIEDANIFGANPDGIIRVRDNVLAVRPADFSKKHKTWLKSKAARSTGINEAKADELRQKAREANVDTYIDEGFDEQD